MKRVCILLSIILLLLGVLCSCDESEPLPEGVSKQPDVPSESFVNSETGEIEWPSALLPEGFPVAVYDKIYSAERKDNEVTIILFGEFSPTNPAKKANALAYVMKLAEYGYKPYDDVEANERSYLSRDGYKVTVTDNESYNGEHLASICKESPKGYVYEIKVRPFDTSPYEYLFWEFPDANTDLGLEPIVFDEWPTEYLPEGFEKPDEKIEILEMQQKNNGLFITLRGNMDDLRVYHMALEKAGYVYRVGNTIINTNGDYIIYSPQYNFAEMEKNESTETWQFCPANDLIKK